jgi:hypothetical protein
MVLSIFSSMFIFLIIIGFLIIGIPLLKEKDFDVELWIRGDEKVRGKMVRDLIKKRTLDGRTKDEVIDLLGPPAVSDGVLIYTIEKEHSFLSIYWPYALKIYFNVLFW